MARVRGPKSILLIFALVHALSHKVCEDRRAVWEHIYAVKRNPGVLRDAASPAYMREPRLACTKEFTLYPRRQWGTGVRPLNMEV